MQQSGTVRLNIQTYIAGKNQPTHPSMVTFEQPWNGYKYWMAYSPYPYGDGEEENPCIAVSNDLLLWETPAGVANPIATNEETACVELKDPHILYCSDKDRLEIWYLGRLAKHLGGDGITLLLFRKWSTDGVRWSNYEVMTNTDALSPSVSYQNGRYQLWEIGYNATKGTLVYRESEDGRTWGRQRYCSIDNKITDLELWHGAVNWDDRLNKYIFVFIKYSKFSKYIFYCNSDDGIEFSTPIPILKIASTWQSFYRPFLTRIDDQYICLYGVVNRDNSWYLCMSRGQDLLTMEGITGKDCSAMVHLTDSVCNTRSWKYHIFKEMHSIKKALRLELWFLAPFFLIGCIANPAIIPFMYPGCLLMTTFYLFWRKRKTLCWSICSVLRFCTECIINSVVFSGVVALAILTLLI